MPQSKPHRIVFHLALSLMGLALLSTGAYAQSVKVEGVIKGRSGNTMILQTADSPKVIVLLNDDTQVSQVQGMLKARKKEMSMAALIPGLSVQVEGTYDAQNELVATSVKFKGNDLEQAQAIQAGVHETAKQTQANQSELEKQNALLQEQNAALKEQQVQLTEQQQKVAANKAAIAANTARFGQLDDYYIYDEATVHFGNGKVNVDSQYNGPLLALAQKATTVDGYMIQIKGYASSSGSVALNQKLSEDRASNVANFMQQQGHVPLSRMLAPGAMGESRQVDPGKADDSAAENRRVVVRVLQNKGIAGIQ
jgi:outer membrane protein OmpA-like peptidoglycan-associated protein